MPPKFLVCAPSAWGGSHTLFWFDVRRRRFLLLTMQNKFQSKVQKGHISLLHECCVTSQVSPCTTEVVQLSTAEMQRPFHDYTFSQFIVNALLLCSIGLSRPCAIRHFGRSSNHARDYWLSPNKTNEDKRKHVYVYIYIYLYITPKKGTTITVHFKLDCHRADNIELSTTTSIGYSFPAINVPKKYRRLYADALYNVIVTTCLLWRCHLAVRLADVNTLQYRSHSAARRVCRSR